MANSNCPCTPDCPDRKMHCAIGCARWAAYVIIRDARHKQQQAERDIDSYIIECQVRSRMTPVVLHRRNNYRRSP